jgi:hypothetical protein
MNSGSIDEMPDEVDSSQGVRGQFYRPYAKLVLPVYPDKEIQARLSRFASDKGVELSVLVNDLLG